MLRHWTLGAHHTFMMMLAEVFDRNAHVMWFLAD